MKKFLILLLLVSFGFSDCVLISSPYPKVESIKESSFYGQKYTIGEVKSFSDAYVKFLNTLSQNAISHCEQSGYDGIYNVRVQQSVIDTHHFYFSASLDYTKN